MTIAKITTAALITILASASFANTKCAHKETSGLFASTNPTVVKTQTASSATQNGTR